uniref:Nucleolar protein 16 n=1 Tax=Polytomella parva TaxID=51329 RepID=A0A7S0UY77_9CHLO|mmetsp:Transcript_20642/g.36998  ORF Transcript_20642/g.36998 Transcript_20642/m.36998 type:complete len:201 (+) Transcript_20642:24-626(+)
MGGSRRRLKKSAPTVRVGVVKRKLSQKSFTPQEVSGNRMHLENRLNQAKTWKESGTLTSNYAANNLIMDTNLIGVNLDKARKIPTKEERLANNEETFSDDDEIRVICNKPRKTGKTAPPRLSPAQVDLVTSLTKVHGTDYDAMVLDRKLNKMQNSAGQLRKLFEAHQYWSSKVSDNNGLSTLKHDFRVPNKPMKRLCKYW